jgi:hypothetical protein
MQLHTHAAYVGVDQLHQYACVRVLERPGVLIPDPVLLRRLLPSVTIC